MNTPNPLPNDATALVTGGARRIGAATVRALHAAGYRVAIHCRSATAEADRLASELCAVRPDSAQVWVADLTDRTDRAQLATAIGDAYGRLDALVHNASVFRPGDLATAGGAVWDEARAVHIEAPAQLTAHFAPQLEAAHGAVVHILDIYTERPLRGHMAYTVSKAAMRGMVRAQAMELAPAVRVNGIAPGAILWPEEEDDRDRDAIIASTALGRGGAPEDIAQAVVFLVRDAHYCTGEVLTVDGGRSLSPEF